MGLRLSEGLKKHNLKCIIIGINNYIEGNNLEYCVNDATSIKDFLIDETFVNVNPNDIILLTDESDDMYKPLKNNILENIHLIKDVATNDDLIFFYFAGHGDEINGEPALLPTDFRRGMGIDSAIKIEDIKNAFIESSAKFTLLIFDSCHSGAVPGREDSGSMTRSTINVLSEVPEGFAIMSSCSYNQLSYEDPDNKHGIFTYYFLEGAKGQADGNTDGYVTLHELFDYLNPTVQQRAFEIHKQNQTPHMRENLNGIYVIAQSTKPLEIEKVGAIDMLFSTITLPLDEYENIEQLFKFFGFENDTDLKEKESMILLSLRRKYKLKNLHDDGERITFPDGYYIRHYVKESYEEKGVLKPYIRFNYNKENKDDVDEVINDLDMYSIWKSINFYSPYLIDMDKLESKCDSESWDITDISLDPRMIEFRYRPYSIQVNLYKEFTYITVEGQSYHLDYNFYDGFNASTIRELLGNVFIVKKD